MTDKEQAVIDAAIKLSNQLPITQNWYDNSEALKVAVAELSASKLPPTIIATTQQWTLDDGINVPPFEEEVYVIRSGYWQPQLMKRYKCDPPVNNGASYMWGNNRDSWVKLPTSSFYWTKDHFNPMLNKE